MSKVSVIVPIYNRSDTIAECVESIINQTYKDIEIILVDDGSSDSTAEIIDAFSEADSRIKVIHKKNGGVSSARNCGLDVATGEYICFVDSDDTIEPNMVERLLITIEEKQCDMVSCHSKENGNSTSVFNEPYLDMTDYQVGRFYGQYLNCFQAPFVVRDSIYSHKIIKENKIEFKDYKKVLSEDALFNLMYWCFCKKYYRINEHLYCYYRHENSLMTTNGEPNFIRRHICLVEEFEKFAKERKLKIKLGHSTACLMWDFIRNSVAREKKRVSVEEMVEDFRIAAQNKIFKKKIFSMAFGFGGSAYRKIYGLSFKDGLYVRFTALNVLLGKYDVALRQYFM